MADVKMLVKAKEVWESIIVAFTPDEESLEKPVGSYSDESDDEEEPALKHKSSQKKKTTAKSQQATGPETRAEKTVSECAMILHELYSSNHISAPDTPDTSFMKLVKRVCPKYFSTLFFGVCDLKYEGDNSAFPAIHFHFSTTASEVYGILRKQPGFRQFIISCFPDLALDPIPGVYLHYPIELLQSPDREWSRKQATIKSVEDNLCAAFRTLATEKLKKEKSPFLMFLIYRRSTKDSDYKFLLQEHHACLLATEAREEHKRNTARRWKAQLEQHLATSTPAVPTQFSSEDDRVRSQLKERPKPAAVFTSEQHLATSNSTPHTPTPQVKMQPNRRACSTCGVVGHNKRTCGRPKYACRLFNLNVHVFVP